MWMLVPALVRVLTNPGAVQGECFGDVGVVSGGEVLCGEREVVVWRDADAVDEFVVGTQFVLCRKGKQAAIIEQ